MKPRIRPFDLRVRLFLAVAWAAGSLLVVKAVELALRAPPQESVSAARGVPAPAGAFVDPLTTNSTAPAKEKKKEEEPPPPAGTKVDLDAPPVSATEKALLDRLAQRRKELDDRERDLETRETLLKAADKKLEERITELKSMEAKAQAQGSAAKQAEGDQQSLKNLVVMYEAMKPKDAARVFDRLGLPVLVPVVTAMNPKKVSEILAAMSPEAAGKLTVELAARSLKPASQQQASSEQQALPAGELPAIDPRKP